MSLKNENEAGSGEATCPELVGPEHVAAIANRRYCESSQTLRGEISCSMPVRAWAEHA